MNMIEIEYKPPTRDWMPCSVSYLRGFCLGHLDRLNDALERIEGGEEVDIAGFVFRSKKEAP